MNKYLVVIDMQNDFIDGALGTPEAQAIVANVKQKIEDAKALGYKIVFTRDTHLENYLNTMEGKNLPVKHCIRDTEGWEISSELNTDGCYAVIDKPNFGYIDWKRYLDDWFEDDREVWVEGPDSIEIVGLCTDICVVSNALILKTIYPEIDIIVDANCCAGVTPETHQAALTTMKMCQIKVIGE